MQDITTTSTMFKNDVSIAKAIGIILMVIGHAGCPRCFHDFIYMFHMPLFFFGAGYCFKNKYLTTPKTYVWRRIKGLYFPFVVIGLFFLFLHNIFVKFDMIEGGYYDWLEIFNRSKSIVFSMHKEEELIGGFWFIPQLFWASLISYALLKFFDKRMAFIISFISANLLYYTDINVPYTTVSWLTFYASAFFLIGNMWSEWNFSNRWYYALISLAVVIAASILMPNGIFVTHGWMIFPYFLVAVSGCIFVMNISKLIADTRTFVTETLMYIGSNTMWILTLHFICFKLVTLLIIKLNTDSIINLRVTPIFQEYSINGGWIIYSIAGVLMPVFISLAVSFFAKRLSSREKNFRLFALKVNAI